MTSVTDNVSRGIQFLQSGNLVGAVGIASSLASGIAANGRDNQTKAIGAHLVEAANAMSARVGPGPGPVPGPGPEKGMQVNMTAVMAQLPPIPNTTATKGATYTELEALRGTINELKQSFTGKKLTTDDIEHLQQLMAQYKALAAQYQKLEQDRTLIEQTVAKSKDVSNNPQEPYAGSPIYPLWKSQDDLYQALTTMDIDPVTTLERTSSKNVSYTNAFAAAAAARRVYEQEKAKQVAAKVKEIEAEVVKGSGKQRVDAGFTKSPVKEARDTFMKEYLIVEGADETYKGVLDANIKSLTGVSGGLFTKGRSTANIETKEATAATNAKQAAAERAAKAVEDLVTAGSYVNKAGFEDPTIKAARTAFIDAYIATSKPLSLKSPEWATYKSVLSKPENKKKITNKGFTNWMRSIPTATRDERIQLSKANAAARKIENDVIGKLWRNKAGFEDEYILSARDAFISGFLAGKPEATAAYKAVLTASKDKITSRSFLNRARGFTAEDRKGFTAAALNELTRFKGVKVLSTPSIFTPALREKYFELVQSAYENLKYEDDIEAAKREYANAIFSYNEWVKTNDADAAAKDAAVKNIPFHPAPWLNSNAKLAYEGLDIEDKYNAIKDAFLAGGSKTGDLPYLNAINDYETAVAAYRWEYVEDQGKDFAEAAAKVAAIPDQADTREYNLLKGAFETAVRADATDDDKAMAMYRYYTLFKKVVALPANPITQANRNALRVRDQANADAQIAARAIQLALHKRLATAITTVMPIAGYIALINEATAAGIDTTANMKAVLDAYSGKIRQDEFIALTTFLRNKPGISASNIDRATAKQTEELLGGGAYRSTRKRRQRNKRRNTRRG